MIRDQHMSEKTTSRIVRHSPQWRDGRFRNETPWEWMSLGQYAGMMREYVFHREDRTPRRALPRQAAETGPYCNRNEERVTATWLGHSSVLLNVEGVRILTDPVFTKGITLLGPWRYSGESPLPLDAVPDTDIVIVSHNHFDHLNERSIRALRDRVGRFVTPIGVGADLMKCGVDVQKIVELDWWEQYESPAGVRITATPAQHFSGRGMTDRDRTLWASFVIEGNRHTVFFGGDSGYFDGFRMIGQRFGPFDLTFVETGAYSRFWHAVHMFPEEAVRAHLDLGGDILHPIHWGTFNLSLHSWYDPMRRLVAAAKKHGSRFTVPIQGQTTFYDSVVHTDEWWEQVLSIDGER